MKNNIDFNKLNKLLQIATISRINELENQTCKAKFVRVIYSSFDLAEVVIKTKKNDVIYRIKSNNKVYIGKTHNIEHRVNQHKKRFGENMNFKIIKHDPDRKYSERYYIELYRKMLRNSKLTVENIQDGDVNHKYYWKEDVYYIEPTTTQKEIQAFRYRQTVANIEWIDAATKYGVKERSIQRINTLYNRLKDAGLESDFDKVLIHFEYNIVAKPGEFSWINKATGTFSGALNQLKTYIELQEDSGKKGDLDLTEINPETGEYLDKMENIHLKAIQNNLTLEEKLEQVIKENQELKEKISELENSISN